MRLLKSLFPRLNLFAFAVPVFYGDLFSVLKGSLCRLLAVLVPLYEGTIRFTFFIAPFAPLLPVLIPLYTGAISFAVFDLNKLGRLA